MSEPSNSRRFGPITKIIVVILFLAVAGLTVWSIVTSASPGTNAANQTGQNPLSTSGSGAAQGQAEPKGGLIYTTPGPSSAILPTGPSDPERLPPTTLSATQTTGPVVTIEPPRSTQPTASQPPFSPTLPPSQIFIPYKIRIPAIKVDTFVERVGVARDGTMAVPKNIWNTAWFGDGGYSPGQPGNAVIAGHLDAPGSQAVFWDLDKLKPGDTIVLTDRVGSSLTFVVAELKTYTLSEAPLETIFGPASQPHLNLITCSGIYNRSIGLYNKRLVVFSKLAAGN